MYWFVPGLGIAKKTVMMGGVTTTTELVSFVVDFDGDGVREGDNCPNDANPVQTDTDDDGMGDVCDDDDDGDGTLDDDDAFPLDAAEYTDTDGDGVGNKADTDDDGDQIPDDVEIAVGLDPLDPADADSDLDGDGLSNLEEFQLGTAIENPDTDGDGISDGIEVANGGNPLVNEKAVTGAIQSVLLNEE